MKAKNSDLDCQRNPMKAKNSDLDLPKKSDESQKLGFRLAKEIRFCQRNPMKAKNSDLDCQRNPILPKK
ncbi:MAG: hypothetical protein DRR19_30400 [Candidatus Parabeggiatoa sp. nov. 1]|nr:MAG: hypothetical protein DRR19_30400 [Gammaproteobacteria bacterium]